MTLRHVLGHNRATSLSLHFGQVWASLWLYHQHLDTFLISPFRFFLFLTNLRKHFAKSLCVVLIYAETVNLSFKFLCLVNQARLQCRLRLQNKQQ